uniref:Uncharacterized protein LOC111119492 isoform X1 n=1 Tax=Crassostrea virginica TaxID=6565 RepID=A0A8B8CI57_CRAVI|nr:uncharacterized protein LOC111119492 isoform X1 [Crassostrea virginica]
MFWTGIVLCLFADAFVLTTGACSNNCAGTLCPPGDTPHCHSSKCVCKRNTGVCYENADCKYGYHCDHPICDTTHHHCLCGELPHDHQTCTSNTNCGSIHCGHSHHGKVCSGGKCYCTDSFSPAECGHHHHHHDETCASNSCNSPYSPLCVNSKCGCIRSPLECIDNSKCTNYNCSSSQEPRCVNTSCTCIDKKTCHFANDCGDHDCGDSGAPVCHHNVCSCESFKTSVSCKPDWEKFGDNCYHLVRGTQSWMDAFKTCHALGSGLVDVGSSEENSFLHKLANGSEVWIAASDSIKEGTWQWFGSNQLLHYTNWDTRQPDNSGGQDCAILKTNEKWDDYNCSKREHFICEQTTPVHACSSTWTKRNGKCYQLFAKIATWSQALAYCQTHSATLVNIENSNDNSFIQGLLHTRENIWIGGFKGTDGAWEWVGGDFPWNYTNWNHSQPNNLTNENCNSMYASSGKWHDYNCDRQQHFICEKTDPPVDGGWTEFGSYGPCSVSCGEGTRTRSRTCTNPAPQKGGADCVGSSNETSSCHQSPCPINGGWSAFGSYSHCSVSCGGGNNTRSRTCTNPAPQHGGQDCVGSSTESQSCNNDPCPINGGWSAFGSYSHCSVSCGGGNNTRSRTCTNPAPQHGGQDCVGSSTETQSCHNEPCPTAAPSGAACPTCDESLNCVWGRVCPDSQTCMIRSYPNYKFSVHCSIKTDCHFIKSVLSDGEIFCCEDRQCLSDTLGI